ncbi:MAG: hypothetical protein MJ102_04695 [Clostridia bacterium]|nr:hypothetical protein [Clostridia bacterium]
MSVRPISSGRRRAYRSRHRISVGWGGKAAIIVVICAILLFAVAVMLGNYLRSLADAPVDSSSDETTAPQPISPAPWIIARGVTAEMAFDARDAADSTEAETAAQIPGEESGSTEAESTDREEKAPDPIEYNAVSVILRMKNETESTDTANNAGESAAEGSGAAGNRDNAKENAKKYRLAYYSETSRACNIDEQGDRSAAETVNALKNLSDYVSVIFAVGYPSEGMATRSVVREYELSLACELFGTGVNEVVFTGFGYSEAEIADAAEFASELIGRCPAATGKVGISLDFDFFDADEDSVSGKIRGARLGGAFLAMDLWHEDVPELMLPENVISDRVSRCSELIERFRIRVIVGCGSEREDYAADPAAALDRQVRSAVSSGAPGVQAVTEK